MTKKEELQKPIHVASNIETIKGAYSNIAVIHHSDNEFILDFLFKVEGVPHLVSRVILSPNHMERFKDAVVTNWNRYEEQKKKSK